MVLFGLASVDWVVVDIIIVWLALILDMIIHQSQRFREERTEIRLAADYLEQEAERFESDPDTEMLEFAEFIEEFSNKHYRYRKPAVDPNVAKRIVDGSLKILKTSSKVTKYQFVNESLVNNVMRIYYVFSSSEDWDLHNDLLQNAKWQRDRRSRMRSLFEDGLFN